MNILSFGEILWDIYPDKKYIGGAPLNFAAHLAKHGEQVYMLSALGDDELGKEAILCLNKWGCSDKYISVLKNCRTGSCLVTLDDSSVPTYNLLQDVAYDYITFETISESFDVLYFGTLALRSNHNFASLKKLISTNNFQEIFVDINLRFPFYTKESVQFSVKNATVLKISSEELETTAHFLDKFNFTDYKSLSKALAYSYDNLKCIIITLGADGAYALDCKSGQEYNCSSEKCKVVSTVGAGDSFSAAFIYWYLRKKDIQFCLNYATKVAGYVVSEYDAIPDYNVNDFI